MPAQAHVPYPGTRHHHHSHPYITRMPPHHTISAWQTPHRAGRFALNQRPVAHGSTVTCLASSPSPDIEWHRPRMRPAMFRRPRLTPTTSPAAAAPLRRRGGGLRSARPPAAAHWRASRGVSWTCSPHRQSGLEALLARSLSSGREARGGEARATSSATFSYGLTAVAGGCFRFVPPPGAAAPPAS